MAFTASVNSDVRDLLTKIDKLSGRMRGKILRKAVTKTGQVVNKAAKAQAPRDSGLTKKSLGYKVTVKPEQGRATAIIGPRRGFKKQIGTVSRGKNKGRPIYRDPANLAHLVEKGTQQRTQKTTGRSAGQVTARPFLRPALLRNRSTVREVLASTIAAELAKV